MSKDMSVNVGGLELKNPLLLSPADHTHSLEQLKRAIDLGVAGIAPKTITNFSYTSDDSILVNYMVVDNNFRKVHGKFDRGYSFMSRGGYMKIESDGWIDELIEADKYAKTQDSYIIPSIWGELDWMVKIAKELEQAGFSAIEIDAGCPHFDGMKNIEGEAQLTLLDAARTQGFEKVTGAVGIPVFYKIASKSASDVTSFVRYCKEAGFAGATMHNRYLGFMPDVDTLKPLFQTWSGIGGSWILPLTLYRVFETRKYDPDFPMFGTNGAMNAEDIIRFMLTGASAYQMCTEVMVKGFNVIPRILSDLEGYMENHGIEHLRDIIGKATDASLSREEVRADEKMAYIDKDKCIKCGICIERCPWNGLKMEEDGVKCYTYPRERFDKGCLGCGLCTCMCPKDAITLGPRVVSE